jgi:hypothetical protein
MKNLIKFENIFLNKGTVIEEVENINSLIYLNSFIKKKIIKIL